VTFSKLKYINFIVIAEQIKDIQLGASYVKLTGKLFCTMLKRGPHRVLRPGPCNSSGKTLSASYEAPHYTVFCSYLLRTSPLLDTDILLSILFSNTLKLYTILRMRDRVSQTYRRTCKIRFNLCVFRYEMGRQKILNWMYHHILS
jgi:hypothetical protein